MAPNASSVYLGVTEPISLDVGGDHDLERTIDLENYLKEAHCYETHSGIDLRIDVLSCLSRIFKQWVKQVTANQKNFPDSYIDKVEGKLYTYGSYRLGVNAEGADIDALAVAPKHIDRNEFFTSFVDVLKSCERITDIIIAENAYVPIVKIVFSGVEIDLIFARLNLATITPETDLKDHNILKNLDQRCVRSLNGCRVTDGILNLVPNHETFRLALRAVKYWAQRRGIYSNQFGYLGGVSYAMLVARICQLYPNTCASVILKKFFLIYSQWQWPKPVILTEMVDYRLNFPVWNPNTNVSDKYHLMPIITPAYPQINSTYNVFTSTRTLIMSELSSSLKTIESIETNNQWEDLFKPCTFFSDYRHYVAIGICGLSGNTFKKWKSVIDSKLRLLANSFEKNPNIEMVIPFPKSFDISDNSIYFSPKDFSAPDNDDEDSNKENSNLLPNIIDNGDQFTSKQLFIGFTAVKSSTSQIVLTIAIEDFKSLISRSKHSLNLTENENSSLVMKINYSRRNDINKYLLPDDYITYSKPNLRSNKPSDGHQDEKAAKNPKVCNSTSSENLTNPVS